MVKRCTECRLEKPESEFYPNAGGKGLRSHCKPCMCRANEDRRRKDLEYHAARQRAWRSANHEHYLSYQHDYREAHRERISDYMRQRKAVQERGAS